MWEALAMVGGQLLSGSMQADAAGDAAKLQADATDRATGMSQRQFDQIRADQAPNRALGNSSVGALAKLMGFTGGAGAGSIGPNGRAFDQAGFDEAMRVWNAAPTWAGVDLASIGPKPEAANFYTIETGVAPGEAGALNKKFTIDDFWADPVTKLGHQTGLDLGSKALYNASPLTTGRDSGAMLKELTKFGTDYTGMKAGESYGRFEGEKSNVFNRLMAMIGGGQIANQATGAAGMNMANNNAALLTGNANAQGAARIAGANAWGGALGNLSNWWQGNQMLDKVLNRGGIATPNFDFTGFTSAGGRQYGG